MKCKILCVEDELEVLNIYKSALEERGHEVIATSDSEECLKLFDKALDEVKDVYANDKILKPPFDAVVLDYKMPKKNGLELAKLMLEKYRDLRIIFASGNIKDTVEQSLIELNEVVEVLKKPFSMDKLIETIESNEIQKGFKLLIENIRKEDKQEENDEFNFSEDQIKNILTGVYKLYNLNEG